MTLNGWHIDCGEGDYNGDGVDSCEMKCHGKRACAGGRISPHLSNVKGLNTSEYRVANIEKLDCADLQSCKNAEFDLRAPLCRDDEDDTTQSEEDGCHVDIDCTGESACFNSVFKAEFPKTITCSNDMACRYTVMQYYNPHPDFKLDCSGIYYFYPSEYDWKYLISIHQNVTGNVLFLYFAVDLS